MILYNNNSQNHASGHRVSFKCLLAPLQGDFQFKLSLGAVITEMEIFAAG